MADAPDLGSGVSDVQVQVLLSAPYETPIEIRTPAVWTSIGVFTVNPYFMRVSADFFFVLKLDTKIKKVENRVMKTKKF